MKQIIPESKTTEQESVGCKTNKKNKKNKNKLQPSTSPSSAARCNSSSPPEVAGRPRGCCECWQNGIDDEHCLTRMRDGSAKRVCNDCMAACYSMPKI